MEQVSAIDLFAGAGGATTGLQQAGISVIAAIENDRDAAMSFRMNHPNVHLIEADIRKVDPSALRQALHLRQGSLGLLKACPPCQGFSSLANGTIDELRNDLVLDVTRFVTEFRPKSILLENVPGLRHDERLPRLLRQLESEGYRFRQQVVDASTLGVPQRRKRLIVIGLSDKVRRRLPSTFEAMLPEYVDLAPSTVGDALGALRGADLTDDALNVHRKHSKTVAARIRAVPINGTRFDLPARHQLACHSKLKGKRATASYGRLRLDEAAPTMTTRCTTPACGSFIHPTEHRGITLREAATLQTFPLVYQFFGKYESIERQIGNAVPVRMAAILGLVILRLLMGKNFATIKVYPLAQ